MNFIGLKQVAMIVISVLLSSCFFAKQIKVGSLQCNSQENPLGIEAESIRLSWKLLSGIQGDKQTAYEIKVATTHGLLKSENPDCWNTGKVLSDQSQYIPYEGKFLESGTQYYWMVRVWGADNEVSDWSEVNTWSTALKDKDWNAHWIGAIHQKDADLPPGIMYHTPGLNPDLAALWDNVNPLAKKSILLRKEFSVDEQVNNAKIYVSGLGHYNLYINGKEIDNSMFKPLWSEYEKTVYYNVFDISPFLTEGKNVIGVILGNGMYNLTGGRYSKFRRSYGPPTLLLQADISYNSGKKEQIVSDASWKYDLSPVVFNCMFGGEDYDACLEQEGWDMPGFDDKNWQSVVLQESPGGKLTAQTAPPVIIAKKYKVKEYRETEPGVYIFNMGQNLSGFPTIKVKGKRGQKIRMIVGETLNREKTRVAQGNSGSPYYFDYTLKGNEIEEWTPMFTYYGYQYVEISAIDYPEKKTESDKPLLMELASNFVYSSATEDGYFNCSNELFNRAHFIIDKAVRSNMQAVFTDCPHREKLGWLEETHLNGPGLLFNYDLRTFYPKIMRDIADSQLDNGLIPDIAPEYVRFEGGFFDSPEWGSAGVVIPWIYYEWYGDDTLIKEYYQVMKRYVDYLSTKADNHILSHGLGDWYDHGPSPVGISQNTPLGITATGHYYMIADLVAKAAGLTGKKTDEKKYSKLAADIANAFNKVLFDPETAQYGNGSQCSNALPLFLGIVPEQYKSSVLSNLLADIKAKGMKLSTGDVGNRYLYQALAENDQNEIMHAIHNHKELPGYGYQIDMGVTTLTEQWDPAKGMSWNHFMMGQIEEWFYKSLAGIKPDIRNPGFKHFFIEPVVVGDINYVNASYNSIYGRIQSSWKIEDDKFVIRIIVPVNTTATLKMPVGSKKVISLDSGNHVYIADMN